MCFAEGSTMKAGTRVLCAIPLVRTAVVSCTVLSLIAGCPAPPDGADTGTLTGSVTNSLSGAAVAGVAVSLDPAVEGVEITTAANGAYSASVPAGTYNLTFERQNFETQTATVTVAAGGSAESDAILVPVAPVVVTASVDGDAVPGGALTATASVEILDGTSTVQAYSWSQGNSVTVTIAGASTATAAVTLPATSAFKNELFRVLAEPPIGAEDLPPNVPLPDDEFPAGIQDRFHVVGLNPFALEETGHVALQVTVRTTGGDFTAEADIHTTLPWKPALGIHNVPIGIPVVVHGKTQDSYDWVLNGPAGSSAALTDAASQNPYFTPDIVGVYRITVTDLTVDPPADVDLEIHAGTWQGAITGQDANGRPVADNCTVCHNDGLARDYFTPWAQTGHAEIFTDSLNTSTHYGENCFACHTVGYDPDVDNGGVDEAADYADFLASGLLNNPGDNWTTVLAQFPETARRANIQCENCHGPQQSNAHTQTDPRVSLSADVCAVCHGEPLRHARFQQWQLSGHANYELAIDEGESGSCARCHTVNGFLAWLPILLDDDPDTDPLDDVEVTWTADEAHPQTCVTCHDPHNIGTTTGVGTNATVRISGDTPPLIGGFQATDVGRGAICMTCHNSRRGLRNDDTFDDTVAEGDQTRAPHGSAQGDMLMGQNAYLVEVGTRGNHSTSENVQDTCVTCHMEATPPPDLLSYQLGGTNHTFFASPDICADCHAFGAEVVQPGVDADMGSLKELIADAMLDLFAQQIAAGNSIDLNGEATIEDTADIIALDFGESRGQQALTVVFDGGTSVGPVAVGNVSVVDSAGTILGGLYDFADARLIKAGWNWNFVTNDGSRGVHNPSFAMGVLDASIDALEALAVE